MKLNELPRDVFIVVIEQLVLTIGIQKAVLLRSVSKWFASAILHVVCANRIVDINDPAASLVQCMPEQLLGKILLSKSKSLELGKRSVLSAIATVNRELDRLTVPGDDLQAKQHLRVAAAAAPQYWNEAASEHYRGYHYDPKDIDKEAAALNVLCGAIAIGNLALVQSLLQEKSPKLSACLNQQSSEFGYPLHLAAAWGHVHVVQHLLDCGADPRISSHDRRRLPVDVWQKGRGSSALICVYHVSVGSPLGIAIMNGHDDTVRLLLEPRYLLSPVEQRPEFTRALIAGARAGHLHLIHALLDATGESINNHPWLGENMLWEACRYSHEDVVQMLLDSGVDIDATPRPESLCRYGRALSLAAWVGDSRMVRFLLERGAKVNLERVKYQPIVYAALRGHQEVVEILIERGASVDKAFWTATRENQDALVQAIINKNPRFISFLVGAGVSLNQPAGQELPIITAQLSAPWIVDHLRSLGAEGGESGIQPERSEDEVREQQCYGRIYVLKRTWEWVGKY
ncbi:ankyrin [Thozetella sp. PMI_491]|nr:ankyrin [Thozetella sp. PMI_491]